MEAFAATLQIVISQLWRKGKLKKAARKMVRSTLSNAEGWLKCNLFSEKTPQPETEQALNDARETMARLQAQIQLLEDPDGKDQDTLEAEKAEKEALIEELEGKVEKAINKLFAIDFLRTERVQVSTDVESIEDYTNADWIGDESFVDKEDALERFPTAEGQTPRVGEEVLPAGAEGTHDT
jgi:chromosome condensin MukBEF ATPase and DNA-binding subunit MukB